MKSLPDAGRRIGLTFRAAVPLLILLIVLAGCATSDSVPGGSRLPTGSAAGTSRFFVNLRSRPQLDAAAGIADNAARGQFVMDELRRNAASSQASLISFLNLRNVKHEAFWIANAVWVEADEKTRELIAGMPEVKSIEPDGQITLDDPPAAASSGPRATADATGLGIEPNVERVHAPEAWALGANGQGIVVGVMDTGFAKHPAISDRYDGFWLDTSGQRCSSPCDGNGHGTHVTGTILGRDGGDVIGVAPEAKFIACKALANDGSGTLQSVLECLQWFMAPGGKVAARPSIVNMSLGGSGRYEGWAAAINNLQAAGTLSVAAAGNSGGCKTIVYPAAISEVLTVGAVRADSDTVSTYSSSGPVAAAGLIKPDLMAQGDLVRSAWPGPAYRSVSGTSMATPAVSGVAALVMSVAPHLIRSPADLATLLRNTANGNVSPDNRTCGGDKRYTVGSGLVDAHAAVLEALRPRPVPE
jgi:subtilisin family serine protease